MSKFPLWMPEGSVRAILAMAVVGAGIGSLFVFGSIPGALLGMMNGALAIYFVMRKNG